MDLSFNKNLLITYHILNPVVDVANTEKFQFKIFLYLLKSLELG